MKELCIKWLQFVKLTYRGQFAKIILATVLTILPIIGQFSSPVISRFFFDNVIPNSQFKYIFIGGLIWAFCVAVIIIAAYWRDLLQMKIDLNAIKEFRLRLFRSILFNFQEGRNTSTRSSEYISHFMNDTNEAVKQAGVSSVTMLLFTSVGFVAISCYAVYLDVVLAILCFISAATGLITQRNIPQEVLKANQDVAKTRKSIAGEIENLIDGWRTIIRFGTVDQESAAAAKHFDNINNKVFYAGKLQLKATTVYRFITNCLPVLLVWLGAYRMISGTITFGTLIAFFSISQLLNNSMSTIYLRAIGVIAGLGKAIGVVKIILDYPESKNEHNPGKEDFRTNPINCLRFEGINIQLDEFNLSSSTLQFTAGKTYLLKGNSGAGKSVLLEVIVGLRMPDSIKIYLNDEKLNNPMYVKLARESFAYVRSPEFLFNRTIEENLFYGGPCHKVDFLESITDALKINSNIWQNIKNLSSGETCRVSIIKELVRLPKLIVFDEALDSFESEMREMALKIVKRHFSDCIIIVCSHNQDETIFYDSIITVQNGTAIQQSITEKNLSSNLDSKRVLDT